MKTVKICGVKIHDIKRQDMINYFLKVLDSNDQQSLVVTPNPNFLVKAENDNNFKEVINNADLSICDSSLIMFSHRFIKNKIIKNRNTGIDTMKDLLNLANSRKENIFLLGASEKNITMAAFNIQNQFPNLNIAGYNNGYFDFEKDSDDIVNKINQSGAKYLFVGMGAPRQELWCSEYRAKLNTKIMICVGGSIDVFSGNVKRAPLPMRFFPLESLWRIVTEPHKYAKRYIIDDMKYFPLYFKYLFKDENNNESNDYLKKNNKMRIQPFNK